MLMKPAASEWLKRVKIRHIQRGDLIALEWDGEYRHFRKVYADAFARFENGNSILWVADLPGAGIIGQVFIQLTCDRPELGDGHCRAYLYSFRVKPEYRGLGLGTKILQVVEEDLRQRGYEFVTLNVAKDNPDAQKLYLRTATASLRTNRASGGIRTTVVIGTRCMSLPGEWRNAFESVNPKLHTSPHLATHLQAPVQIHPFEKIDGCIFTTFKAHDTVLGSGPGKVSGGNRCKTVITVINCLPSASLFSKSSALTLI
jgi:ribosomal protein S18 acetylase RimI-like enzyme